MLPVELYLWRQLLCVSAKLRCWSQSVIDANDPFLRQFALASYELHIRWKFM